MDFIKRNFVLFLIFLLTIFLRFNYDTLISGFNYDEFAIISIAKLKFPFEILKYVAIEDFHAPLYYLIAHFFTCNINCDLLLRLLNICFSVINVYVFYKIGKILINKNFGLILALLLCVNHLQIAIANFIKFYCLSFLLFSISIYYFIKFVKYNKNEVKLGIFNALFILSFTFGFIWIFFEFLVLFFFKKSKKMIKSLVISAIGFILYLPILFIQTKTVFDSILSPHGSYPSFSLFGFYVFLNDYFSPLLNYSYNTQTVESAPLLLKSIKSLIQNTSFDYISFVSFVLLSLIPVLIALFGIFSAFKNDKIIKLLSITTFSAMIFYGILIIFEITGYIPFYQFSCGLALIIISGHGLFKIKNKKLKFILISYLILAQISVTNCYPIEKRSEKDKNYGNIDKYVNQIDNKTPIIMIDAGRFAKHYYNKKNVYAIDYEQLQGVHSKKWIEAAFGKDIAKISNAKNLKDIISPIILNNQKSKNLENYLLENLISKINKNDKLILIFNGDGSVFCFKQDEMEKLLKLPYNYKKENSSFLYQLNNTENSHLSQSYLGEVIHSYIIREILEIIEKYFKIIKVEQLLPTRGGKYFKSGEIIKPNIKTHDLMTNTPVGWIIVTYQKQ